VTARKWPGASASALARGGRAPSAFAVAAAAVLAVAAAGAGLAGCRGAPAAELPAQAPDGEVWLTDQQIRDAKLEIAPAAPRVVTDTIATSGRVTFDDLRVSHVFSPVTGRITKIEAQLGEKVKKGQTLAIIDSPDLGLAGADLAKADADLLMEVLEETFDEVAARQ